MSQWRAIVRSELEKLDAENGGREVTLDELEKELLPRLESEFPDNDNLDAGLRRTLQELRDEGEVVFLGDGEYRLTLNEIPDISALFQTALREYEEARTQSDRDHPAAKLIDDRLPHELTRVVDHDHLSIKSSVGSGSMANIPWIGIFDSRLTTSPQEGLYVVYLFDPAAETLFLTLDQGMTELQEKFGRPTARSILEARAEAIRTIVDVEGFKNGEITLTPELLTGGNNLYGIFTICYRAYQSGDFPESPILIDDVNRLVSEYQRLIQDGSYETLQNAFDEQEPEQPNPFRGSSISPPVDEYDGVTDATEDVLDRLENADIEKETFRNKLSKSIVAAWTDPLKNIAVQTASEISPTQAVLIKQIKAVYAENEEWLTETSDKLGIGSLFALDPSQVLYMALLRDIQSDIPEISQVNVNHVKLKTIFNNEYSVRDGEDEPDDEDADHYLLSVLESSVDGRTVHLFTGPPDYWLTAIRYRAISFEADARGYFESTEPGDIVLLHSQAEPGNPELGNYPNGFIGAGILGEVFDRDGEQWWWDEYTSGKNFPYTRSFDRLFMTGEISEIDEAASIEEQSTEEIASDIDALTRDIVDFTKVSKLCRKETGTGLSSQGAHSSFTTENEEPAYERPRIILRKLAPQLDEIPPANIYQSIYPSLSTDLLEGLYYPDDQDQEILKEIEAALRGGKHIIFTGPPGTGKTEIADQVVETLQRKHPYLYSGHQTTTATADWSTFDTVGGYMPSESSKTEDGENLTFTPGTILNRLRDQDGDVPINEPLVMDELNRANIDKAFGQLFTVLSGQSVTLPYTRGGQEIEILPVDEVEQPITPNQYVIPSSWRIFATMNTYDKTSLYEMSYAFMRRFAFIRVGAPTLEGDRLEVMENYVGVWEDDELEIELSDRELRATGDVWYQTNSAVEDRAIGPAIIRDIILYLDNHSTAALSTRLTKAVISYVFPQLEGVPKRQQIVENIAEVQAIDDDQLRSVAREMLQISFEE